MIHTYVHHGVHRTSMVHIAALWYTRPPYAIEMVHKGASINRPNTHTHTQTQYEKMYFIYFSF